MNKKVIAKNIIWVLIGLIFLYFVLIFAPQHHLYFTNKSVKTENFTNKPVKTETYSVIDDGKLILPLYGWNNPAPYALNSIENVTSANDLLEVDKFNSEVDNNAPLRIAIDESGDIKLEVTNDTKKPDKRIDTEDWYNLIDAITYNIESSYTHQARYHDETVADVRDGQTIKLKYHIDKEAAKEFCDKYHCKLTVKGAKKESDGSKYVYAKVDWIRNEDMFEKFKDEHHVKEGW